MTSDHDDYLFRREGPPDPDVARLERLLAPLAHPTNAAPPAVPPRSSATPGRRAGLLLAVAAGMAVLAILALHGQDEPVPPSAGERLPIVAGEDTALDDGAWVETRDAPREIRFGELGRVLLDTGSRLRVTTARSDETLFFLERGRLEAFVSASARPRFFQVETPAARCVDLGCRYTLDVDEAGVARVEVTYGQVAFETPGREVYVPAGAICTARPDRGPGTPRFRDAGAALVGATDAYDDAPSGSPERRRLAGAVLERVATGRDALVAWHLLADPDPAVATAALHRLVDRFGAPTGWVPPAAAPTAADRRAWRAHLGTAW